MYISAGSFCEAPAGVKDGGPHRLVAGRRPRPGDRVLVGADAGWHAGPFWLLVVTVDDAVVEDHLLIGGQRIGADDQPHESIAVYVLQSGLHMRCGSR